MSEPHAAPDDPTRPPLGADADPTAVDPWPAAAEPRHQDAPHPEPAQPRHQDAPYSEPAQSRYQDAPYSEPAQSRYQDAPPHPHAMPPHALGGAPFGAYPGPAPGGPVIVQIGELAITSSTVHTPAGDIPLRGSTWNISDQWYTEQRLPTWAAIMAIAGFCVLTVFSLFFLLVKETVYRGTVQISVSNGQQQYVSRIQVSHQAQVQHLYQQVNYVRSLAAL